MSHMTDFSAASGRLPGCLRQVCIQADQLLKAEVGMFGFAELLPPPINTDPVKTVGVSHSFESCIFIAASSFKRQLSALTQAQLLCE